MKHWTVDYSVRYINGEIEEKRASLEAGNIRAAVDEADRKIRRPLRDDPEVTDVVIWDVGIIEDDVFMI